MHAVFIQLHKCSNVDSVYRILRIKSTINFWPIKWDRSVLARSPIGIKIKISFWESNRKRWLHSYGQWLNMDQIYWFWNYEIEFKSCQLTMLYGFGNSYDIISVHSRKVSKVYIFTFFISHILIRYFGIIKNLFKEILESFSADN